MGLFISLRVKSCGQSLSENRLEQTPAYVI